MPLWARPIPSFSNNGNTDEMFLSWESFQLFYIFPPRTKYPLYPKKETIPAKCFPQTAFRSKFLLLLFLAGKRFPLDILMPRNDRQLKRDYCV
ncbi:hypothetical protein CEXT_760961 [Caerostris extrusa]|uniref:Uncharacterized protein n=1 Tax=Caerostris extrusa TaxID=172846 RepID=A0AAV4Q0M3_CAEEX|nr:hypothetical protein CEXT_760961 [Caerostris extrusa]